MKMLLCIILFSLLKQSHCQAVEKIRKIDSAANEIDSSYDKDALWWAGGIDQEPSDNLKDTNAIFSYLFVLDSSHNTLKRASFVSAAEPYRVYWCHFQNNKLIKVKTYLNESEEDIAYYYFDNGNLLNKISDEKEKNFLQKAYLIRANKVLTKALYLLQKKYYH